LFDTPLDLPLYNAYITLNIQILRGETFKETAQWEKSPKKQSEGVRAILSKIQTLIDYFSAILPTGRKAQNLLYFLSTGMEF